ncbi:hypothetical protein GCM10023191_083810 [Actinoallomurus oryzae]|uniref:Amino acid permease n=1 Tax=Actinoallomurus oryzae TaxID=502180 RepID=A0ABP8R0C0_9ACTN
MTGVLPARRGETDEMGERHRLSVLGGLAALSLDAMASVAYGPEAIVIVLAAGGGAALGYTVPVTLAIAALLGVLTLSYRQVIAAFPQGGGAYGVARTYLGPRASLVAAASLVVDYVLNVAVSIAAGVAALTSAMPGLLPYTVRLCLGALALITAYYVVQLATVVLLAPAANTSFGGMPVLTHLLARDNNLPHLFALRAERQVHRYGILFLTVTAALLIVGTGGAMNTLVPLFAIGVFVVNRLTQEAISAAMSLGDRVVAVRVVHPDEPEETTRFIGAWERWAPDAGLALVNDRHRRLVHPIVEYVRGVGEPHVFVLIPEVEPAHLWQRVLQNQRGAVLAHALRRDTDAVVCRLRFRLDDGSARLRGHNA